MGKVNYLPPHVTTIMGWAERCEELAVEYGKLQAENERLREALEQVTAEWIVMRRENAALRVALEG